MASGIYMLLNLVTDMYYVGQAVNFEIRWKNHIRELNNNRHCNILLQRAWNKYGEQSFKFYVLEWTRDLNNREQYWLDKSKCYERGIGYNISKFAEKSMLGRNHTKETKSKISLIHIGIAKSEEHKAKLSVAITGKKHSEETKAKMLLKRIGGKRSEETKKKMSISQTGKKMSEKARINMSIAFTSRITSKETKIKQSASAKKYWAKKNGLGNSFGQL